MPRPADQEALHKASGAVKSNDPLVSFLYLLMRDKLPVGVVDAIVTDVAGGHVLSSFTNGFLARHAMYLADEMRGTGEIDQMRLLLREMRRVDGNTGDMPCCPVCHAEGDEPCQPECRRALLARDAT